MTPIAAHYQPILHFISKRVHHLEDAQDLTQEVFYKLIQSQKKENISNPQGWLYSIAKNTIIDYYRKNKIQTEEIDADFSDLLIENQSDTPELSLSEEQRTRLRNYLMSLIEQLPEEYRMVIQLSELEGLSQKEIAEELNMNYTTLRSKVQRGRAKLKKMISDCCDVIQGGKGSIIGYRRKADGGQCGCSQDCNAEKIHYL